MSAQVYRLEGALNFRDLGGLPTSDGRATVPGALFRSDALEELTAEDVRVLREELEIGSVIDLRAQLETGSGRPAWAEGTDVEFVSLPLSHEFADWGPLDVDARRTLLARTYLGYLEAASHNVVAALRHIAANAGTRPTIVHCAVGKDRTGVVVSVLLSLLGVERDAVVADYLVTAGNMERLLERLSASEVYRERVRTNPAEVYRAEEHTMRLFLDEIDARHGGVEAWAVASGLEPEAVGTLRERLLTGPGSGDAA